MGIDWNAGQAADLRRADEAERVEGKIIKLFNPPDDEEFVVTLARVAEFLEASDCHCCVSRPPGRCVHVCKRCEALGRKFDERVAR